MRESDLQTLARHPEAGASAPVEGVNAAGNGSPMQSVGSGAAFVAVLDRHGVPLMPCHPARARELLTKGRAVVARYTPFVIRLKDRQSKDSAVPGVAVRVDPGSKGTGIVVTVDVDVETGGGGTDVVTRRGLIAIELRHRGANIHKAMLQRAGYRRARRSRNLRYRAPRFDNRSRRADWLAPSLQHRVDTTCSTVRRLIRYFSVAELHVERVSFDTHAMSQGKDRLEASEYQQGTLHGYEVRQYLLEKWGRACVYCGAGGIPLQVEHIQPRVHGGSDRISNLTLACAPCNTEKGTRSVKEFLSRRPGKLKRILAQAKVPLRDAAAMNATRWRIADQLHSMQLPVFSWSGGRTKYNRVGHGLGKTHSLDALAVGDVKAGMRIVRFPKKVLVATATGRGTYARTRSDRYGFPRLNLPRAKQFFGYATGDLVRAVIPSGKYAGSWTGRVAVRATGRFNVRSERGVAQGIHYRYIHLLQRADGYGYITREEEDMLCCAGGVSMRVDRSDD
ncbi:RNA-guided endonuclease IscB [Streptomyces sp. WI04-05B]|uniref:RNA-guided endonuclease IscB n=2 Tax=Streptomyces TaxID=1883 RepID=UPI0029C0A0D7|nr:MULTISPECIES: RNA-guided endonuclease IscB [unclassified Streptomyces]